MNKREQILDALGDVTPLPASTGRLLSLVNDPDAPMATIAQIVEQDHALAANILRLVNSSYYSPSRPIGSVRDAITRIGLLQVARIATSNSIAPMTNQPVMGYDLNAGDLWSSSLSMAIATEELAKLRKVKPPVECFTAGLLADVGKLVLGRFVGSQIDMVRSVAFEQGLPFDEAEREVLGIDHCEVGAELLRCWKLPDALIEVVRWHHDPEQASDFVRDAVDMVHAASQLIIIMGVGSGSDGVHYRTSSETIDRMHISSAIVEQAISRTMAVRDEVLGLYEPANERKSL